MAKKEIITNPHRFGWVQPTEENVGGADITVSNGGTYGTNYFLVKGRFPRRSNDSGFVTDLPPDVVGGLKSGGRIV